MGRDDTPEWRLTSKIMRKLDKERRYRCFAWWDRDAILFMMKADDGKISVRKLAVMAVDAGLANNIGGRDTKIQRLQRFYGKWRADLRKWRKGIFPHKLT